MPGSRYNPEIHHRRSHRLKGHDYAGGGLYFITICTHRDAGNIFAPPDVREMVGRVWESVANAAAVGAGLVPAQGTHKGCPYVVMPDHFHALVWIPVVGAGLEPARSLGDVVGAFKSLVVNEYIAAVKSGKWPRFPGKIWHRNYYECIVRNPEAERKIGEYIRMNPWKCIAYFGNGMRGIGNPALLNCPKIGVLCSRKIPPCCNLEPPESNDVFIGGFHSPPEKQILERLLERGDRIICCPAWGLKGMHVPEEWLPALEANRMLLLEMKNPEGDLAAAKERNMFVMQSADQIWVPHATPGGMVDRLMGGMDVGRRIML